jgi:hypothetical protein
MVVFGLLPLSIKVVAQESSADVLGTVTDATGAVIPGATVTLTNLGTQVQQQTTSNSSGDYVFTLLKPGTYSLSVAAPGFKVDVVPTLVLAAGDRNRENAVMSAGKVTESVTVTADLPLLQRESSSITSVVTEQPVQDLPLNGRNLINLVQIQAGVNAGSPAAISSGGRPDDRRLTSTIVANGQSDIYNNQLVDGMDNNEREQGVIGIRPSIDGVAEVKVDTNNFTAEVGRDAGAVVNVITKSGTNSFHGSAYEFFRNDIFDARDFFTKSGIVAKPEYRQNQFGASIGGPIIKNKTFFFADAEDFRMVKGNSSGFITVPTLYEEQNPGDFTDIGGPYLPQAYLSPTGLAYFKLFPAPNVPGATFNNFISVPKTTQNSFTADARIDHHFNNGDQIYGRYSYNNISTNIPGPFPAVTEDGLTINPNGSLLGYSGASSQKVHGFVFNYVHLFSPMTLLELKAGYTRIDFFTGNLNEGKNVSDAFGVVNGNSPAAPDTSGLTPTDFLVGVSDPTNPALGGGAYGDLGDSPYLPIANVNNIFQYQGAVTHTRGTHTFKIGGQLIRRHLNYLQSSIPLGALLYVGLTGNPVEDMLAGYNFGYERGNTLLEQGFRMWEPSGYAQDDWRVTPNLTLNIGVRYDWYTPISEAHGNYANFDYPSLTLITGNVAGDVGLHTKKSNIAPRIGFAQSVGSHTVIRGGYGISYYPTQENLSIQLANPPNSFTSECIAVSCIGATLPVPTPSSITNLSGGLSYAPSYTNTSTLQMYNFAVQQEIKGNALTVAYVGELGQHLLTEPIVNLPDPNGPYPSEAATGPGLPPPLLTATALPNVQTIQGFVPDASSNYNALQVIFARRFSHGLSFNSNYTYARSLTDALGGTGQSNTGANYLPREPFYNYGNSSNDVRHRVATSATYQLPFAAASHGVTAILAKNWTVNLIDYWQTGLPFTVYDNYPNAYGLAQVNLPTIQTDRPDVTGAPLTSSNPSIGQFFNIAAFTPQRAGTAGNEHVNQLYGPHQRRADLSFFKAFDLPREMFLQFRAEIYNISNTPNFSQPNSTISNFVQPDGSAIGPAGLQPGDVPTAAGGFGQITSTNQLAQPRQFQFALKLLF